MRLTLFIFSTFLVMACSSNQKNTTNNLKTNNIAQKYLQSFNIYDIYQEPALLHKQWHLYSLNYSNFNIFPIWKDFQGRNIQIALIDSGIQSHHPSLKQNIILSKSFRYSDQKTTSNPSNEQLIYSPISAGHGTLVAGLIAGHKDILGVAPKAKIISLNAFSDPSNSNFSDALMRNSNTTHIYSNSWSDEPGTISSIELDAINYGAKYGRSGLGSLYVFAAGNNNSLGNNVNFYEELNNPLVFTVCASDEKSNPTNYSVGGASVLLCSFGGSQKAKITSTDLAGDAGFDPKKGILKHSINTNSQYSDQFQGTSAAVPMLSAALALILEARPNLTRHELRFILAKSSDTFYNSNKNAANLTFHQDYGFGTLNIHRALKLAQNQKKFKPLQELIFDLKVSKIKKKFISKAIVKENLLIDFVELILNIDTNKPYDLNISLQSPGKTISQLIKPNDFLKPQKFKDIFKGFSLGSTHFLAEQSKGIWQASIHSANNNFTIKDLKLKLYAYEQ